MKTQGAIFDVDGTLVDSVDLHARNWQRVFAEYGKDTQVAVVESKAGSSASGDWPVTITRPALSVMGSLTMTWL